MKYESHTRTNAQQAPAWGFAGEARHASRSLPDHVALITKKRRNGGTIQAMKRMQISVSAILKGDENKLARGQWNTPARDGGGGRLSAGAWRRNWTGMSDIAAIAVNAPQRRSYAHRDSSAAR